MRGGKPAPLTASTGAKNTALLLGLLGLSAPLIFGACSAGSSNAPGTSAPGTSGGGQPPGGSAGIYSGAGNDSNAGQAGQGGADDAGQGVSGSDTISTGASGGTPVPGAGGGAGGHDSTVFDWPEGNATDGGGGTLCKAGHYVGTYGCMVHTTPANPSDPADAGPEVFYMTGPVDLVLQQSQSGEFLAVSGGTLNSVAAAFFPMQATIDGTLDCQTGAFAGTLENGTLAGAPNAFGGSMKADFSAAGPVLTGSWSLFGEGFYAAYTCAGPWSATWQAN